MAQPAEAFNCLSCDGTIPALTAVCKSCGARYKRGVLIENGGKLRKRTPIRARRATAAQPPEAINLDRLPFQHYSLASTRVEAINQMYADYDAKPGRRRKPAREAFEVLSAVNEGDSGVWVITVRKVN